MLILLVLLWEQGLLRDPQRSCVMEGLTGLKTNSAGVLFYMDTSPGAGVGRGRGALRVIGVPRPTEGRKVQETVRYICLPKYQSSL